MSKRTNCDVNFAQFVILLLCTIAVGVTNASILETPIKLLINNDELLLQQPQRQQQQQLQQQQQELNVAHEPEDAFKLYRSELKRLSYESIHRILRDENEPIFRREDAELRYYQKRSYQPRHELVKRAAATSLTAHLLNLTHSDLSAYNAALQFQGDYTQIDEIDLSNNQLELIENLSNFTQLKHLNLCNNTLSILPLDVNSTLLTLNLNHNRIRNATAPSSNHLLELHLSANDIESLNTLNLTALSALETLDLSCNKLKNLAVAFFPQRMHNLKHLNLAHNQLGSIYRETFYNLLSLNTLLLQHNNISEIDYETFLALPNLQYLDLSHNQLKGSSIRALQGIPDLMVLSIAYNPQVGAAMQEFVASWSLKELDASGTGLCQIPAALAQSVRTLKLTDNWLKYISCGDLDSYPLLQYLDLSHSRIEDIEDDALGRLEILETLFLDHNRLRRVPLSLPTTLTHLFLQNNQIMDIQVQSFQGLKQLQTLDLSGNKLLYLPALPLPKLLTLNVQSSELKGVSQAIVHTLPHLRDLLLEDNPIKCSDLLGIAEWASACREIVPNEEVIGVNAETEMGQQQQEQQQQLQSSKIDLKQQYVQLHNFYEKFQSNCGLTRQITTMTLETDAMEMKAKQDLPACATATVAAAAPVAAAVAVDDDGDGDTTIQFAPLRGSRGATFAANENAEMPNEKLSEVISLQSTATTPTMLFITKGETMSKVKESSSSSSKAAIQTTATTMQLLNNSNSNSSIVTSNKNLKQHSMETKEQQQKVNKNNTNSLQTTETLRPAVTPATTVTKSLVKQAYQQQQMPNIATTIAVTAASASAKHANHVTISNENILANQQTTAAPAMNVVETTMIAAINSEAVATAAIVTIATQAGVTTESALNNVQGAAMPSTISTTATIATTKVAAIEVPQTILTTLKSGNKQTKQQQQQNSDYETTRSLLNQNNIEPTTATTTVATITTTTTTTSIADMLDKARQQDEHEKSKEQKNVVVAANLSDTSGQPATTATKIAAPTTKTNAKMTITQTTQQHQQKTAQQPPHKHEPLQLHIKDRHLIGTPLLMHKGENMLVDAEQLLLPGTATVGSKASIETPPLSAKFTTTTTTTTTATKTMPTTTTMTALPYLNNIKQASGKGSADILDSSQQHSNVAATTAAADKEQQSEAAKLPEAINVQTNAHYEDTKLAHVKPKVQKDTLKIKKKHSTLSIKKMTYTTKHAETPIMPPQEPLMLSSTSTADGHKHNSVNTPNAGHAANELNTFAQLKERIDAVQHEQQLQQQEQQQQQHLTKSEHWLDARRPSAKNNNHPGVVLLLSLGLIVVLLAGLMHVYRCDLPWRRHGIHSARPHRHRQFSEDDAHSFLNYQNSIAGGSGIANQLPHILQTTTGTGTGTAPTIQKWHHSTRREAPYSSPLHNLQVRELQHQSNATQREQQQQLQQQLELEQEQQRRCQQFYSASLSASSAATTTTTNSSQCASSNSSSNSSLALGLNRSPTSSCIMDANDAFYIEMQPETSLSQQHACDLLPMELLASGRSRNQKQLLQQQQQRQQQQREAYSISTTNVSHDLECNNTAALKTTLSNKLAPTTRRLGIW